MASSTRGKRSAAAAAAATQETGTPAKVARVGGAEPAVKDKAKKKGENDHHLHLFAPTHGCTPVPRGSTKGLEFRTIPAPQSLVAAQRVWSSDHTCTPVSHGSTKGLEFRPYLHPSLLWQREGSGVQTVPAAQSLVAAQRVWSSDHTCTPVSCGSTKGLEFRPYLHPSLLWQREGSGVQTIPAPQSLVAARRVWSSDHTCTPVSHGSTKGLEFRPHLQPSLDPRPFWLREEGSGE